MYHFPWALFSSLPGIAKPAARVWPPPPSCLAMWATLTALWTSLLRLPLIRLPSCLRNMVNLACLDLLSVSTRPSKTLCGMLSKLLKSSSVSTV